LTFGLLNLEDDGLVQMPSGLLVSEDVATAEIKRMRRPTCIDLFAGCGGFSLGMIQGGFEVVAALEWDSAAAETYMVNLCRWGQHDVHFIDESDKEKFNKYLEREEKAKERYRNQRDKALAPDAAKHGFATPTVAGSGWINHYPEQPGVSHFFMGDVRHISGAEILDAIGMEQEELDCIVGGPPCQGFSRAGHRNVMDPRNSLVFEFMRLVCEIRPKTMIFENVPGIIDMVTPDGQPVVDACAAILRDGGFADYKRFLKAVEAQTGRVGVVRSTPVQKAKTAPIDEREDQLSFLEAHE